MVTKLPRDFKDFLRLLRLHKVEYLVIGGYAVAHYGYPRPTADFDIWLAMKRDNATRVVAALNDFGFAQPELTAELLLQPKQILRMRVPPMRLELMTHIDGVEFDACYERRVEVEVDQQTKANIIALIDLKQNKRASGRAKDIDDLEHLG